MKYVYGPVPSRRLGQSLGIDPIPLKTCNWNCVYCQLGRTKPVTNKRASYYPPNEIVDQVEQALNTHKPGEIDWLTFVGSGEPTLHIGIGRMIREVKALTDLPIAVITNGALFYQPVVREELAAADAVLPSLDAGRAELYRKINRPHPEITFERLLEGLITFSHEYKVKLWPEVMLVRNLNDSEELLFELADAIHRIEPDKVHINLPTRPPVETWVQPPDAEALMRATAILGNIAQVVHPIEGTIDLSGYESLVDAVIDIISRHPMRESDLEEALSQWVPGEVSQTLDEIRASGQAQIVERYGIRFWCAAPSFFP
ncbi:MAG TPA: radical SAM protein [Anaerolineae bacterium]|nr:radical SAM protein [Anaerolineae bacterium]